VATAGLGEDTGDKSRGKELDIFLKGESDWETGKERKKARKKERKKGIRL